KEIDRFIAQLKNNLSRYSISPHIYVGRKVENILKIDLSYKDTEKMVQKKIYKNSQLLFYDDFTVENLFWNVPENEIVTFVQETLKHFIQGNSRNEAFLQTIKTFLECDQNYKMTCSRLNIHINTLYYRLKVIEKELKIDL